MAEQIQAKTPRAGAPEPVPGHAPGGPPAGAAASPGARETAPKFGGLRGGRKRDDGLIPGSPEAAEADKKKDANRKKLERKQRRDLAPLPSAMEGATAAPDGSLGAMPGPPVVPVVPWTTEQLKPLFDQLIPAAEELTARQIGDKAAKARLPGDIIREIQSDAKWPDTGKKGLEISAPQVAAKWLNKSGLSAEYQPELTLAASLALIFKSHVAVLRRLDKLIAAANVQTTKPNEEKKP